MLRYFVVNFCFCIVIEFVGFGKLIFEVNEILLLSCFNGIGYYGLFVYLCIIKFLLGYVKL